MKKVIFFLLSLLPFIADAQTGNGGQYYENSFAKIEYIGYSNGSYVVNITNKQFGTVNFQTNWLTNDTTFSIGAYQTITVYLAGPKQSNVSIKTKPKTRCGGGSGDLGWLEIWTPTSLPIHFIDFKVTRVNDHIVHVVFTANEDTMTDHFNILASKDGVNYTTITIMFPQHTSGNHIYSVNIDLNKVKF